MQATNVLAALGFRPEHVKPCAEKGCGAFETVTPAKFELDGYFRPSNGVTGSGEIQVPGDALKALFGMRDLHLQTDRGLLLALRFSDLKLPAASDFVRVEVTAQPTTTPDDWRQ